MNQIRLAGINDICNIMKFINDNWKENHILSRDKDFFIYEHQNEDKVNYVISLENNKINGVLGFIKYSKSNSDIATVTWKALKSNTNPMLGIELLEFLRNDKRYNVVFSPGINKKTIGIYQYLGIYTNHLSQYVIINKSIQNFNILKIEDAKSINQISFIENARYSLSRLKEDELDFNFDNQKHIPHKDKSYFIKRYFNHPVYEYKVYGVYNVKTLTSLIVTREVSVKNRKILRIMDYIGNENDVMYISKYLYQIVVDRNYEYIDFMCYGFSEKTLEKACFTKVDLNSKELIVPNYFAPFVQENIQINFMADIKENKRLRICKADGDQDRPN